MESTGPNEHSPAGQPSAGRGLNDAQDIETRARGAERKRIAQVLHDGLQQLLVAAKLQLHTSTHSSPIEAAKASAAALVLLDEAIQASRTLTSNLSPLHYGGEGLRAALAWLSDWFMDHHGFRVEVDITADAEPESETLRALMFQGVREILFNAVKHARVDNARVRLARRGSAVQVTIEDHGVGFEPAQFKAKNDGFGLFSVKQRLERLGGRMDVVSAPGAGTRVTLQAPLASGTAHR